MFIIHLLLPILILQIMIFSYGYKIGQSNKIRLPFLQLAIGNLASEPIINTNANKGNKKGQRKGSTELTKVLEKYEPVIGIEGRVTF